MKFLKHLALVLLLAFLLETFLPWWSIAIAAGLIGLFFGDHRGRAFAAGFAGIFLLWVGIATLQIISNDSDLHSKFGQLLPGAPGGTVVLLVAGLVGGLVGAFASFAGAAIRKAVKG